MADILIPDGYSTGLIPRDYDKNPLGSLMFASPFPEDEIIPDKDIEGWIKQKEEDESTLLHHWKRGVNVVLDQNGLGYCHAFSPTSGVMVLREVQGLPFVLMSASSIGGPVTGYRNQGAYIHDDCKQLVSGGISPVAIGGKDIYPMTTTKNYMTDEAKALASLNRCEEFWEGDNRQDRQVISCLCRDKPVPVGYNWWGHAVTLLWVTLVDGVLYYIGINSWKSSWQYGMDRVPAIKAMLNGGGGFFCFPVGTIKNGVVKLGMYGQNQGTPDEWYALRSIKSSPYQVAA